MAYYFVTLRGLLLNAIIKSYGKNTIPIAPFIANKIHPISACTK